MNSVDLAGPIEEWKDLAPVDDGSNQYLGDLCLSLRYVPSSGKLTGYFFVQKIFKVLCIRASDYTHDSKITGVSFTNFKSLVS